MKYLFLTSAILVLLTVSCTDNGEKKILSVEKKIVYKEAAPVEVNRQLAIEVMGMSCEHACGGSIRKALKKTHAVERCSFDFKAERKVNTAFITFDKDKISQDAIINIIKKVNNGQFTTGKTVLTTIETPAATEKSDVDHKTTFTAPIPNEISSLSFELPNLFELISCSFF